MARYKKKRSFRKSYKRKTRGKSSLKKTIRRVLNRQTETKYFDLAVENVDVYHNVGPSPILPLPTATARSDPTFFNPWSDIPPGTGRANRIGDKIRPVSMQIKIWLANKLDRPNIMYRIMVVRMPKAIGTTSTTSSNVYPFQAAQLGGTGNSMILPLDHDRGVRAYYDRVVNLQIGKTQAGSNDKEIHKLVRISLRRKSNVITFDSAAQNIVNSPLALYIIPYDSFGTLVTDIVASYSYHVRMNYKDT